MERDNEKIVVIFGGSVNQYVKKIGVFEHLENTIKIKISNVSDIEFESVLEGIDIQFLFAYCPTRDAIYVESKKWIEEHYNEIVPPPADEICKSIKHATSVFLFGLCGSLEGKRNQIYAPTGFREIIYPGLPVSLKQLERDPSEKITINNIIKDGRKVTDITTNVTLMPENIEEEGRKLKRSPSERLSEFGEIMEKEGYQVVKLLKDKFPLGIGFVSSDAEGEKKYLDQINRYDYKDTFNQLVAETIRKEVKRINGSG